MDAQQLKDALGKFEKYLTKTKKQGYMNMPISSITLIGDESTDALEIEFQSDNVRNLTIEGDGRVTIEIMQEVEL